MSDQQCILILGDDDGYSDEITRQGLRVAAAAREADGVIFGFGAQVAELDAVLAGGPRIRWVQLHSAGIERFGPALVRYPHLTWTSAKGAYAQPVAEHALTLALALLRELPTRVRARSWGAKTGASLHGRRVLVVGAGGVGQEVVRLMRTFDTHVTVVRRISRNVPFAHRTVQAGALDRVLPATDVLILAAAYTAATDRLIDAGRLRLMPRHAIIVNVARGALIDTSAITAALAAGELAGAGLDVTDPEPLPDGHPLWDEPRCIITPHAADTIEMIQPMYRERIAANLTAFSGEGDYVGLVDPYAGY